MNIPENILQQVADEAIARAEKAEKELSAQLGILRPIAEMPETVPEGCFMVSGWQASGKYWMMNGAKHRGDTHFAILRLPGAEAMPPAEPEPAAQVPLGPEDCPPGSVFRNAEVCWYNVKYVLDNCVCIDINGRNTLYYQDLKTERWQINTSFPDTGRWDKDAWRPCSKPRK